MISQTTRAPKGVMWETIACWSDGGPVVGRVSRNWVIPKAVRMDQMLVSCEKSKYCCDQDGVWRDGKMAYQSLVEGKGAVHLVEGCVDVSGPGWQVVEVALKTSVEFLNVADADTAAGG